MAEYIEKETLLKAVKENSHTIAIARAARGKNLVWDRLNGLIFSGDKAQREEV